MGQNYLFFTGIAMIIFGIFIVLLSFLFTQKNLTEVKAKAAGIIFIGPIPIAFGTDKETIIFLALIMLLLMLLSYFLFFRG